MNNIIIFVLMAVLLAWLIAVIMYIMKKDQKAKLDNIFQQSVGKIGNHNVKMFYYEKRIFGNLTLTDTQLKVAVWAERVICVLLMIFAISKLGPIAVALLGAVIAFFMISDANKNVISESGIDNITLITNFINTFVPNITAGNSGDQAMVVYMDTLDEGSKDRAIMEEWYDHKDDPTFHPDVRIREVVEIYDIVIYNEEQGISDYIHILEEMQRDYTQKQQYYTSFTSRISEINPICWSYYIAVPIIILLSYSQTYEFWWGVGGVICSVAIVALFVTFEFLVYKIRKNTIQNIF